MNWFLFHYFSRVRYKDAVESFLEELVVRRELSDNFCHCECLKQYDCKMPREVICIPSIHSEPHTRIFLPPSHLADTPDAYDSLDCAAVWARESLELHQVDKREHLYTR